MTTMTRITTIVVTPDGADKRPLEVRERHALKALLRRFGLRCLSIRDTTPAPAATPATERGGIALDGTRSLETAQDASALQPCGIQSGLSDHNGQMAPAVSVR